MAKGASGLSGGSSNAPATGEDTFSVKVRDRKGEPYDINVSIQNMSNYKAQTVEPGQGIQTMGVARFLADEAAKNATDPNRENKFDFPEGKEGVFTKTDKVPIIKNMGGDSIVLDTRPGYVTKINGETVYLQKSETGRGFMWNYAGMGMGIDNSYRSLKSMKENTSQVANIIDRNHKANSVAFKGAPGVMQMLNKNQGKVDLKVYRAFSQQQFADIAEKNSR